MCLEEFSIARECRIMKPRALDLLLPSRRVAAEKKRRLQRHRGAECRFFALSYLRITRQYGAERIAIHQRLWCPDARKTSSAAPGMGRAEQGQRRPSDSSPTSAWDSLRPALTNSGVGNLTHICIAAGLVYLAVIPEVQSGR